MFLVILRPQFSGGYHTLQSQELLVLGRQFLTDLRDSICCLTDKLMKVAGQHDHSGYFLIEVCFFLFENSIHVI